MIFCCKSHNSFASCDCKIAQEMVLKHAIIWRQRRRNETWIWFADLPFSVFLLCFCLWFLWYMWSWTKKKLVVSWRYRICKLQMNVFIVLSQTLSVTAWFSVSALRWESNVTILSSLPSSGKDVSLPPSQKKCIFRPVVGLELRLYTNSSGKLPRHLLELIVTW